MGWWASEHGIIGDEPADILDATLDQIEAAYERSCQRPPTQGELADLIEFCTAGTLVPRCGDVEHPFRKECCHEDDTPRVEDCGRQGVFGVGFVPGKLANVDPSSGRHYDQSEPPEITSHKITDIRQLFRLLRRCSSKTRKRGA